MEIKCIEIRDRMTCIPAIAIKMRSDDHIENRFLRRCGYSEYGDGVVLMRLADQVAYSDPYDWDNSRTMPTSHEYIINNFDQISNGAVIDVEVLLGEKTEPSAPEIGF